MAAIANPFDTRECEFAVVSSVTQWLNDTGSLKNFCEESVMLKVNFRQESWP
jgi:hypothetical protein